MGNEPGHPERTYLARSQWQRDAHHAGGSQSHRRNLGRKISSDHQRRPDQYQLFPVDGGQPQPFPQLHKEDRPFDFTSDDAAVLVRRTGHDGSLEIWRVERVGGKRTLLRTISLPGVPAVSTVSALSPLVTEKTSPTNTTPPSPPSIWSKAPLIIFDSLLCGCP